MTSERLQVMEFRFLGASLALILTVLTSMTPMPLLAQPATSSLFTLHSESAVFCEYWWGRFTLSGDELVQLQWNTQSEIPTAIDLYVTTLPASNQKWFCDNGPQWLYYNSAAFGSGNWMALDAGTYLLIVVNYSTSNISGSVTLTAQNGTVLFSTTGYGLARQPPYLVHHCRFIPDCG